MLTPTVQVNHQLGSNLSSQGSRQTLKAAVQRCLFFHSTIINTIELKMVDFKNISRLEERVNQAVINRIIQVNENVQIWDENLKAGSEFAQNFI